MKNTINLIFTAAILTISACGNNNQTTNTDSNLTLTPESGTSYKAGDVVVAKLSYPAGTKADSVVYLLDSVKVASTTDTSSVKIETANMPMGMKVIVAKFYQGGKSQDISTNFVVMPANEPEKLTYVVEKVFPHDTSAYTEGLLYQDGYLYESTGNYGHSELRKVDLNTGKVLQKAKIDAQYFGEGSAVVGDKIMMLTYKEKVGFVFDKNTFKLLKTFNNNVGVEGWGVTYDGNKIYMDDSTNRIWFLDKDNYNATGFIDVYDNKGPIDAVNELEYVDGKLYSNVYTYDTILNIDPKTGAVLQMINMNDLWPISQRPAGFDSEQNVLNGIAWDAKGKRLFVTGKKWPHVYQVRFVKK